MTEHNLTDERDRLRNIMKKSSQMRSYYADVHRVLNKSTKAMSDLFGWTMDVREPNVGVSIKLTNQNGQNVFYAACANGHLEFNASHETLNSVQYGGMLSGILSQFIKMNIDDWITDMGSATDNVHGFTNGIIASRSFGPGCYDSLSIPYHIALDTDVISNVIGGYIEIINYNIRLGNKIPKPEGYDERLNAAGIKDQMRL